MTRLSAGSPTTLSISATFVETGTAQRLRARLPLTSTLLGDEPVRSTLLTSRLTWTPEQHCHAPRRGDIGYQSSSGRLLLFGEDARCATGVELVGRVVSNLDALSSARPGTLLQIGAAPALPHAIDR